LMHSLCDVRGLCIRDECIIAKAERTHQCHLSRSERDKCHSDFGGTERK
jgi:hypothetical protein